MTRWVPAEFTALVDVLKRGARRKVVVRDLLGWFGFERRGVRQNAYVREAMIEHGVRCEPAFDVAFVDDEVTFCANAAVVQPATPESPAVVPAPHNPSPELPAPIAELTRLVKTQTDIVRRVGTRVDLTERLVVYLATSALAALRIEHGDANDAALRAALGRYLPATMKEPAQPLSFGAWVDVLRQLARIGARENHPALRAAVACAVGASAPLARVEREVVPFRNKVKHGAALPEATYVGAEPMLADVTASMLEAARPLLALELVCVDSVEVVARGALRYRLRVLHGPGSTFEARELVTAHPMVNGWAHLLGDDCPPIRLSPGVWCEIDRATEEVTIFVARSLALDEGQSVSMVSVRGGHQKKVSLSALAVRSLSSVTHGAR